MGIELSAADPQVAAHRVGEGVQQRVLHQVADDLAQRPGEAVQLAGDLDLAVDQHGRMAQPRLQHAEHLVDGRLQMEAAPPRAGLVGRDLLEMLHQFFGMVERAGQDVGRAVHVMQEGQQAAAPQRAVLQGAQRLARAAVQDRGRHHAIAERRVELVRHAGNERAQGGHLLDALQLVLRFQQMAAGGAELGRAQAHTGLKKGVHVAELALGLELRGHVPGHAEEAD